MTIAQDHVTIPTVWRSLVNEINGGRIHDGENGIRDVDAPCDAFMSAGVAFDIADGTDDCETDGHYLCSECVRISQETLRRRRDLCRDCGAPLERAYTKDEACSARCSIPTEVTS